MPFDFSHAKAVRADAGIGFNFANAERLASEIERLPHALTRPENNETAFYMPSNRHCIAGQARRLGMSEARGSGAIREALGCSCGEARVLYFGGYEIGISNLFEAICALPRVTPKQAAASIRALADSYR